MSRATPPRPSLLVLAGVNGAGKSSVAGAWLRGQALDYYNPDEATALLKAQGVAAQDANAAAWAHGRDRLVDATVRRQAFAFETTLGGSTIPALIRRACDSHDVTLWFVGLDSPERHLARIAARVLSGGHDIPEARVRARWDGARRNLVALMPYLFELRVYDNSVEQTDATLAQPALLLHVQRRRIKAPTARVLRDTPAWARPLVEAARQLSPRLVARKPAGSADMP
ncbi:MAG TPA: hypothetical protein VLK29_07885 [Luteimonas sp.]|nr:hypothetical protein [Luteimonas sp.]